MLSTIYELLVAGKQKAITGFVVVFVLGSIAFTGITGDMTVKDALSLLVTALLAWLGVYFKANK